MTNATKRLAKGNFEVDLKMNRVDEIGELTQSYVEMAGELKQLEQMRQDFVSNVSHEIKTPLIEVDGAAGEGTARTPAIMKSLNCRVRCPVFLGGLLQNVQPTIK